MSSELHDLEHDLRETIDKYVEELREIVEDRSGTESVAQGLFDAVDDAVVAVQDPLNLGAAGRLARFRSVPDEHLELALELFAAKAYSALMPDMVVLEKRAFAFSRLAQNASPSPRASATLANVARCFLFGFDAETVAMCRAALEVSVKDAMEALLPDARQACIRDVSMRSKLECLRANGRLSESAARDAADVWTVGNEVLHNNVQNVGRAAEMVDKTLRAIAEMFSHG